MSEFTAAHRGGSGPPLVCLHGFTDTWRTWDLVLPELERHHDVLAPTLAGHAGGPAIPDGASGVDVLVDAVERAMDDAGFGTARLVGNSLGGYVALHLAARGRADSVVALAPAGGWADGDDSFRATLSFFPMMQAQLAKVAAQADALVSTPEGRRRATMFTTVEYEHIPSELLAHQIVGVVGCEVPRMVQSALDEGYRLDAAAIECPVRMVWGTEDRLLAWPSAAARYREEWLPTADWVELDGVGHCPQLDVPTETAHLITGFP
ncbi:MAG TPA: alpha/beta hydrolase [Thermoleophilaceae bacterium]|nr:alpha/beta hydrolase [Thermoleophilaceae bacterium]